MNDNVLEILDMRRDDYISRKETLMRQIQEERIDLVRMTEEVEIIQDDIEELRSGPMDDEDRELKEALEDELHEINLDLFVKINSVNDLEEEINKAELLIAEYRVLIGIFEKAISEQEVRI